MKDSFAKFFLLIAIAAATLLIVTISNKVESETDYTKGLLAIVGALLGFASSLFLKNVTNKANKRSVFVSYSEGDKVFASRLIEDLRQENIKVSSEYDVISPGDYIEDKLRANIESADTFLVIIPKDAHKSRLLEVRIDLAKKRNVSVIPIITEESKVPFFLKNIKPADFRSDYDSALRKVVKLIE